MCRLLTYLNKLWAKTIKKKVVKQKFPEHHFVFLADNNLSDVIYFIALWLDDL